MSYLALARKWRPTQFSEVVGQAHVLTALENALAQNRLHHAYLFSGTRGVGKTTIGRLFAKGLNCETGVTSTPCGQCTSCQEIDQGRFVDLLEIDAASRTKVEDTRELLDNVQYKPARGRYKVYLIDEVHMLSRHSFNALLKTLEEPPEYVKFLLATTDPQKLPVTILSRCLQFHLKPISIEGIEQQLRHVLEQENVSFEARALGLIAHAADGSMRDALSLSDQAIALGNNQVVTDSVSTMLGTLDSDQALHLIQAISSKQAQTVIECINSLAMNGVEWDVLLQTLASQLHRIAMYQMLPATLDKSQPDAEKIELLSKALSAEDVQLFYQIAIKGRESLPLSPTPRIGVEMTLLRMVAFRPQQVSAFSQLNTDSQPIPQPVIQPVVKETVEAVASSSVPSGLKQAKEAVQQRAQPQVPVEPIQQASPQSNSQDDSYNELAQEYASMAESYEIESTQTPPSDVSLQPLKAEPEPKSSVPSPVVGLRHQLRSQRKELERGSGKSGKKSEAASSQSESVFERLAQRADGTVVSQDSEEGQSKKTVENEPYQWRPSVDVAETVERKMVTPTKVKQALEHEKTPEMVEKLSAEVIAQDEWAALIKQLTIGKLVEQLALNSASQWHQDQLLLTLRPNQEHLRNDRAIAELCKAISNTLDRAIDIEISIGDEGLTPLERREQIYQGKLKTAIKILETDANVRFLQQRFSAELDIESVRPL
ncbi:DNA polymerase III subunit gamma/tau [Vibrio sp. RC27]